MDDWIVPRSFEAPEGNYINTSTGIATTVQLTSPEQAELAPIPTRFSFAGIKGEEPDGKETMYTVANIRKAVYIFRNSEERPVDCVQFARQPKESPTCHDINLLTRSPTCLQVLIGFTSGEIIVHDVLAKRTCVLNRGGEVCSAPVTCVRWIPGSETCFFAAFHSGAIFVFDAARQEVQPLKNVKDSAGGLEVVKAKSEASNPVSAWHLSDHHGAVYDLRFSLDSSTFAVVGRDGCLRIISYTEEREVATLTGYFGALTCVAWSSDRRFIITGGQDDLVTVWSVESLDAVARCQGHSSWVTAVAFDQQRCDERTYRFGSVGQDARLLLWDFSPNTLSLPRVINTSAPAAASPKAGRWRRKKSKQGLLHKDGKRPAQLAAVPARGKKEVPMLEPVASTRLHYEPITDVAFMEQNILTVCQAGTVMSWLRPDKIQATAV